MTEFAAIKNPSVVTTGLKISVGQTLPAAVDRIIQVLNPQKVILFGSFAYGSPTPDSDVDLLVIMDTDLPASQRYLAVSRLLDPRPFPVDILVKRPDEINHALQVGDFLIQEIMTRGLVLYERSK